MIFSNPNLICATPHVEFGITRPILYSGSCLFIAVPAVYAINFIPWGHSSDNSQNSTGVVQDPQCTNMHLQKHQAEHLIFTVEIDKDGEFLPAMGLYLDSTRRNKLVFMAEWHEHKVWHVPLHDANEICSVVSWPLFSFKTTYLLTPQLAPKISK